MKNAVRGFSLLALTLFCAWNTIHAQTGPFASSTTLQSFQLSANTGEKPQSKVWTFGGRWWAVLATTASGSDLYRLDGTNWTSVLHLSGATDSHADARVTPNGVAHILLYSGTTSSLVSVEYVPATQMYQMWAVRPTAVAIALDAGVETATIDIDTQGRMWLASDANSDINVRWSDSPHSTWSSPITIGTGVNADDISVIAALPSQGKIGVLWSNQVTQRFGFKTHTDGANPATWSADEIPASQSAQNIGAGMGDDHLNMKVASDGTIYAAVKTGYDTPGYPKVALLIRRPAGTWDDLYEVDQVGTRGIALLNEMRGDLTVCYTLAEGQSDIVYKRTPLSSISFGARQTLIGGGTFNEPTSTKQNYGNGIVILATNVPTGAVVGTLAASSALDAGLVAYYKMDEGSGTSLRDTSGMGNHQTLSGAPGWTTGVNGLATVFNGTTTYATVANNASVDIQNAITLAAWVRPEQVATQDLIKKATNGSVDGYELSLATTSGSGWPQRPFVRFNQVSSGDTYRVSALEGSEYPIDGTWMHYAATYDGITIRLYINGVLNNSMPAAITIASNTDPLSIGAQSNGTRPFKGRMDEVLVYNRALSAEEIAQLAGGLTQRTLTLSTVGSGSVTKSPDKATYNDNEVVTLTAVPAAGHAFSGWSGDLSGSTNPADITMNANKAVTATFQPLEKFVAFNDFAISTNDLNRPYVTTHTYQTTNGVLKDSATGLSVGARVTGSVVGGTYDLSTAGVGGQANAGTDAGKTFGIAGSEIVDLRETGQINDISTSYLATFNGLDPGKRYTITLTTNRNNPSYANERYARVTIEGATAFTNGSSPGVIVYSESSVSFCIGDNTANGYVARWIGIATGSDSSFAIRSQWDNSQPGPQGYAMMAFRLEEAPAHPPAQPTLVSPPHAGTGVTVPTFLNVGVSDPNADNMTVTYYGRPKQIVGPDFTIVALPDAQNYTGGLNGGSAAIFNSQTAWCVSQQSARNIAYVAMEGDITNDNNALQWDAAVTAMSALESPFPGIPYGISLGNHDGAPGATTLYNEATHFGIARFSGRSYYGGHYGSDNDNHYELFSAGGLDFVVVNLGSGSSTPVAAILAWANDVLQTNSSRRAIVVSHHLLASGNPASWDGPGQAIYDALKGNPNLFLMLAGHLSTEGRRADTYNGNTVYTILSDYQSEANGGNGWLRILTFSPANNQISVASYSPWTGQSNWNGNNPFTLSYNMSTTNSFELIGTNPGVASGSNTSMSWPGLAPSTEYEWYVTVSDGISTIMGPTWTFTTGAAPTTHTITASAGANGSISPEGTVTVVHGADQLFAITADPGYVVSDVLVNGSSVGAMGSYTFTAVTTDHTIAATFASSPATQEITQPRTPVAFAGAGTTLSFGVLPYGGGHVTIIRHDDIPSGPPTFAVPPVGSTYVPVWLEITSTDIPNHSFSVDVSVNVNEVTGFDGNTRLLYYSETTGSWIPVAGTYDAGTFTFTTDHFTAFAFINTAATPYNLYVSTSPFSASGGAIFANSSWKADPPPAPGYMGADDWSFSGAQPVNVYVVPGPGTQFGACDVTLEWDASILTLAEVDFGSKGTGGTPNGLFGTGHDGEYSLQALFSQLGMTNRVRINCARTDGGNFTTSTGDFIARLNFTLLRPGHTTIAPVGVDCRYFNDGSAPSGVFVVPTGAEVKAYVGDVVSSANPNSGDGMIDFQDLAPWSLSYWSGYPPYDLTNYKVKYDFGPTQNHDIYSLPVVDQKIDFEDLTLFSISYGLSTHHFLPKAVSTTSPPLDVFTGQAVAGGSEIRVPVLIGGTVQDVRAMSILVRGKFGRFLGAEKGSLLNGYSTPVMVMSRSEGVDVHVDFAVMGLEAKSLNSEGELLILRFEGNTDVRIARTECRNSRNETLTSNVKEEVAAIPTSYELEQNYPNPFNPVTTLGYQVPATARVEIAVFTILGGKVATLVNEVKEAGRYRVDWNGADAGGRQMASGIYLYSMRAGEFMSMKKMLLLK